MTCMTVEMTDWDGDTNMLYCKGSVGVAQWALKSRVEGRKITFARC
jgi:hypothetical protein